MKAIPRFSLYGEPPHDADEHFVHVEPIERRSRPHDWTIRPHSHRDLHHLFVIIGGRGELTTEARTWPFCAPTLLLVPAGEVHALVFQAEVDGFVITFADRLLRDIGAREARFVQLFEIPACISPAVSPDAFVRLAREIEQELIDGAPANVIAVEAMLACLLVHTIRAAKQMDVNAVSRGPRAALVDRFRALIERELRSSWPVSRYARTLDVSMAQLRAACMEIKGQPPIEILLDRLATEAKRNLTYTDMRVAEVAYDLGFADPAYFSRFFTRRVGKTPGQYRQRA